MTLFRPCVRPSVCHSVRPSVRPILSLQLLLRLSLDWFEILYIAFLSYEDVHAVSDFFLPTIFDELWPLLTHTLSPNSCHIFYRIALKLCWMFPHDLKLCMWFWIFSFSIFEKVMAFCHFWHFSNFWTVWPRKLNFGELLVFDILIILIIVRIC